MRIYLAGPIRGLTFEQASDWREHFSQTLRSFGHIPVTPMRGKEYLRGRGIIDAAYEQFPMSSEAGIYGRDIFDVASVDVVLANFYGAEKISLGTCMEVQAARDRGKYVLVIMEPDGSNPNDHPFVRRAASLVVEDEETALDVLKVLGIPYTER